jgi:hypothetical protein
MVWKKIFEFIDKVVPYLFNFGCQFITGFISNGFLGSGGRSLPASSATILRSSA